MKELLELNKYFLKYKFHLGWGIFFVVLANVFAVLPPVVIRTLLDTMYESINYYHLLSNTKLSEDYTSLVINVVISGGILLIAFAIIRGIFMFFMRQTIIVMSRHIEYEQKNEIFDHFQRLDTAYFKTHATGDLMSRISEDVSRVRMYTGPALMYTINLLVLTGMSVWGMFRVSWELSLYALFFLPLLAFSMIKINALINKKSSKIQAELGELTAMAQESFSGIRVLKSYTQEQATQDAFEQASARYRASNISLAKVEAMYSPLMGLFIGLSLIVTVLVGGLMVIRDEITVGNIAEFIIYITMLTFPVSTLGWTSTIVQRAAASQKRINEFLQTEPNISFPAQGHKAELQGKISFQNVSFEYPHSNIKSLKNISLDILPGQKVAILGRTGSGKSTLAHLLLRMYEPGEGQILIDDVPVNDWDIQSLRTQISYVPQDVFLFSDTIKANIAFGLDATDEETVVLAARTAHIHNEISALKEQYHTMVGERGVMLSGGQKQRISIARALAKPHRLLIMDDSISAVDNTTEQHILHNLHSALQQQTVLIITHRIFKGWDFDQILVMENGQITERGTHEVLMALKGYYYELYNYQTGA